MNEQTEGERPENITLTGVRLSFPNLPKMPEEVPDKFELNVSGSMAAVEDKLDEFMRALVYEIAKETGLTYGVVIAEMAKLKREMAVDAFIQQLKGMPPRQLSSDNSHPWFNEAAVRRIGVVFNGKDMPGNVCEYDVDAGYVRVHIKDNKGNWKRSRGRWISVKLTGTVEPYWRR